jgi:alpha-glucoside transport system permease protein
MQDSGADPIDPLGDELTSTSTTGAPSRFAWQLPQSWFSRVAIVAGAIGMLLLAIFSSKVRATIITVIVAVAVCAGIWIGANLLFDQARDRWQRFQTLAYAVLGAILGIVLHGNQLTLGSGDSFLAWVLGPLLGGLVFGGLGYVLAITNDPQQRMIISVGTFAVIGLAIGLLLRAEYYPGVDWLTVLVYTAAVAGIAVVIALLTKRPWQHALLTGAALGWILGYWGGAEVGGGSRGTAVLGALVPAILLGVRLGQTHNPDYHGRLRVDRDSRAWIFLGPGLLFIAVMLVVPTIRTAYLSLLDRDSELFVGLDNYIDTFTDKASWDGSEWTNMFTSYPFLIGVTILIIALVVGTRQKQVTGRAVELGNPTVIPLIAGFLFVCFGVFTALRGTIINNLWWVVTVTFFSTAIGLAIAVLADGRSGEKIAKSIIFMPMALSLVGASIIWRFVYQTRDISKEQTGVANALWIGLGNLSTGSGVPTVIVGLLLGIVVLGAFIFLARALVRRRYAQAAVPAVVVILLGWIFLRFTQIIGGGIGGFAITEEGETVAQTIVFTQESPYNNFWLMVILIWIQVGFSMVILSAAIKAVPTELIEAAKIDGATDSQIFWRVTLPQIGTTIGVVVTTVIVLVMKVFDIVKVVTNGQFDTQVLANDMFQQAFNILNIGRGAALAMLIFVSVLPVMYLNIRRMQREA